MKLPYDYVSREVDLLYDKKFDDNDLNGINNHCDFIRAFINACGWEEDQFIQVMMGFEQGDILN